MRRGKATPSDGWAGGTPALPYLCRIPPRAPSSSTPPPPKPARSLDLDQRWRASPHSTDPSWWMRLAGIPTDILHAVLDAASQESSPDCLLAMRFTCRCAANAPAALSNACPESSPTGASPAPLYPQAHGTA